MQMEKKGNLSNIRILGLVYYLKTYDILICYVIFIGLFIGYFRPIKIRIFRSI